MRTQISRLETGVGGRVDRTMVSQEREIDFIQFNMGSKKEIKGRTVARSRERLTGWCSIYPGMGKRQILHAHSGCELEN